MVSRLEKFYIESGVNQIKKKFGFVNSHSVPKLKKITVSFSSKDVVLDSKVLDKVKNDLMVITGQRAVDTTVKKSIAAFKIREGMKIGAKVTLRRAIMYEFLDRLINVALPRVRDFKGLSSKQFDGNGNFSFGIKEHVIFPEIDYDKVDKIRGIDINIVTSTKVDAEAKFLLEIFNLPFLN